MDYIKVLKELKIALMQQYVKTANEARAFEIYTRLSNIQTELQKLEEA